MSETKWMGEDGLWFYNAVFYRNNQTFISCNAIFKFTEVSESHMPVFLYNYYNLTYHFSCYVYQITWNKY